MESNPRVPVLATRIGRMLHLHTEALSSRSAIAGADFFTTQVSPLHPTATSQREAVTIIDTREGRQVSHLAELV